jgi:hypothetical protein
MPKENIDYSNTIIYKIYCIDETIKDIYVGHTTHFIQRKYQHKVSSNESKNVLKIYKTIRENGGWDNWSMVEIATYNCKNSTEARIKEQLHYEELNASLNSCAPYIDKTKYFCVECDLQCKGPKLFNNHINCISHNKKQINPNNEQTIINKSNFCPKFICEYCDYKCCKLSEYNKHLLTNKHKILQNPTHLNNQKTYTCVCGKNYKHSPTLYAHKKKNNCQENIALTNLIDNKLTINTNDGHQQLIEYLMKENSEFKQLMIDQNKYMMELAKNAGNHNNNTINTKQ